MSRHDDDESGKGWVKGFGDFFVEIFGEFLVDLLAFLGRAVGHLIMGLVHLVFHIFD